MSTRPSTATKVNEIVPARPFMSGPHSSSIASRRSSTSSTVNPARVPASAAANRASRRKLGSAGIVTTTRASSTPPPSHAFPRLLAQSVPERPAPRWHRSKSTGGFITHIRPKSSGVKAKMPGYRSPVDELLEVDLPADTPSLRVARLVVWEAATRAGFDCDGADDLCLALDEVCFAIYVRVGPGDRL